MSNLDNFAGVYQEKLKECVLEMPARYAWPVANVPTVAARMKVAIQQGTFNHDSPAFKRTCKELGIKYTRKAIKAYVNPPAVALAE